MTAEVIILVYSYPYVSFLKKLEFVENYIRYTYFIYECFYVDTIV